jgi:hypothetical protein
LKQNANQGQGDAEPHPVEGKPAIARSSTPPGFNFVVIIFRRAFVHFLQARRVLDWDSDARATFWTANDAASEAVCDTQPPTARASQLHRHDALPLTGLVEVARRV